jgi:hypothetical protein
LLNKIKVEINDIKYHNLVITGEMIWSGWLDSLGIIYVLKNFLRKNDFSIYLDRSGLWDMILNEKERNNVIYKISKKFLYPDILLINTINTIDTKKIQLFDQNKLLYIDSKKFINIFAIKPKLNGNNLLPNYLLINNNSEYSINDLSEHMYKEYTLNELQVKNLNTLNKIIYQQKSLISIKFTEVEDSLLTNGSEFNEGEIIGKGVFTKKTLINFDIEKFKLECMEGQLVNEGDILGYKLNTFSKSPIKSNINGRVNLKLIKNGFIIIEKEKTTLDISIPFKANLSAFSKSNGFDLIIDTYDIPLFMQVGENAFSVGNDIKEPFPKLMIYESIKDIDLSAKEIIEQDINMIIIYYASIEDIKRYLSNHKDILGRLSFGVLASENFERDRILENIIDVLRKKYFVIQDGYLKIIINPKNTYHINLLERFNLNNQQKAKIISYKAELLYGNIIKPSKNEGFFIEINSALREVDAENLILLNYFNE